MRKIILFLAFALLANKMLYSQNMGTIEVNSDFTATLNFADSIVFIVVGNNPPIGDKRFKYYDIFQSGKSAVIRGADPKAPSTSITVKLESEAIWFGKLRYGDSTKIFYDFTKDKKKMVAESKMKEVVVEQSLEAKMKERLNSVLSDPIEYSSIGAIENGLTFQIANIKNDENYTYYKVIIKNNTGSDYNIDGIYFKVVEAKRKGFKKVESKIEQRLKIEFDSPLKVVTAYKTEELGFVVQRFTGSSNAILSVQLRELNGTRSPIIEIPGEKMLNVKVFEQKLQSNEK